MSLRKSRRTHCSRSGEPPSDRHSRERVQGRPCRINLTRAAGLAAPRPARISKRDFSFRRSANASLRPRGGDLPRIHRRGSPERGEGRPDRLRPKGYSLSFGSCRQEGATGRRQRLRLARRDDAAQSVVRRSDLSASSTASSCRARTRADRPIAGFGRDHRSERPRRHSTITSSRARTEVKVALSDRREFEAEIALARSPHGSCVLKIKSDEKFSVLGAWRLWTRIEAGDFVLAIGNPFGVGQTVTQVDRLALARTQIGINGDYGFFIQTGRRDQPGQPRAARWSIFPGCLRRDQFWRSIRARAGSMGIGFKRFRSTWSKASSSRRGAAARRLERPWLGANLQEHLWAISRNLLGLDRPTGALVVGLTVRLAGHREGRPEARRRHHRDRHGQLVDDAEGVGFRLGVKPLGGVASLASTARGQEPGRTAGSSPRLRRRRRATRSASRAARRSRAELR